LAIVTQWVQKHHKSLSIDYFGPSTGGAAALIAAAQLPTTVSAIKNMHNLLTISKSFNPTN
ncbi:MAG: hypothetical protein Q8Q25_03080, partial [bacterium]|nr:hypothetical protein [bacterium]